MRNCLRDCFFVQPSILEDIIRTGTPEQREWALQTLVRDHSIRSARAQTALLAGLVPTPIRPLVEVAGGTLRRTIFDAENGENPDVTKVVRQEGQGPVADNAVNQAYDGFGATFKFYWEVYTRNSIDDMGLPIEGVVHFGQSYDNAFWNGSRMIFGDGDGQFLLETTGSIDVMAHELTHGVTQYTANLTYLGQSGALNESISDVFGSLVKQYQAGQTAEQADWLIGAGIVGPALDGKALRSMAKPGTAYARDPQPATMANYVRTSTDNGGVHINSGIPNCAFYNAAMGIGGNAWEKAGQVWYDALRDPRLNQNASFQEFAQVTVRAAQHRYGSGSELKAVVDAWKAVGIVAA